MANLIFYTLAAGFLLILFIRSTTVVSAWSSTFTIDQVDPAPVAIIFGAGLWRDGSPTPVLRDRVKTGADLYFAGKVEKLLMSGDNHVLEYNEPAAMRDYALDLGVPEKDIVMDYAGRRTYDTCYRAKSIFGLDTAILVTQRFHLPRAIYICKILGLETKGIPADQRQYRRWSMAYWHIREAFATLAAFWDLHFSHPLPILGDPEPIFSLRQQTNREDDTT